MLVYRICRRPHSALDGEGARSVGGRWNSPGRAAVYTSEHLSLAALEYFVHVDPTNLPADLVWVKIEIPDTVASETFPGATAPDETDAAIYGDDWLSARRSLILVVPSAVLSVERNVIINPGHAQMAAVRIVEVNLFDFDDRMFK
jgi:RES domain-containing protein